MVISVRAQRVNRGLTQEETALRMGISTAKYQRIEAKPASMRLLDLYRLADVLDVEPEQILASALSRVDGAIEEVTSGAG